MTLDDATYIPPPITEAAVASYQADVLQDLVRRQALREAEALRIYEPLPMQDAFHRCTAREVLARGSNRSGKTTTAMTEVARAATAQDPYGKYPLENGKILLVGKDQKHIAGVFFNKLFRRDAFRIIKDTETKKWRAFHEWDESDRKRRKESKMSGPLIPQRFVQEIAWANKKAGVPEVVRMKNGWELWFFTGEGEPPNGVTADLAVFDEEIVNPRWYEEVAARLGDKHGRFIWSATPQNSTIELYTLSKRAYEERNDPNPSVVDFYMTMADNRNFPQEERALLEKKYANNPEAYKIRILGEFNVASYLVYPTFAKALHGCKLYHRDRPDDGGVDIDKTWNRYMVVDPGRAVCAVAFFAVPPPTHPNRDQIFLYDELYIRGCNSEIFGDRVYAKVAGLQFQSFLIDPSSARQDTIGGGPSVFAQYAAALAKRRIESVNSGSNFTFACNDQKAGILKFESWLHVSAEYGRPKFQYVVENCPNFEWEIEQYRRKKDGDVISDKPVDRDDHMCDCVRYFAMLDPKWIDQPAFKPPQSAALTLYLKMHEDDDKNRFASSSVNLGPGKSPNITDMFSFN